MNVTWELIVLKGKFHFHTIPKLIYSTKSKFHDKVSPQKLGTSLVKTVRISGQTPDLHDERSQHPRRVISSVVPTSDRLVNRFDKLNFLPLNYLDFKTSSGWKNKLWPILKRLKVRRVVNFYRRVFITSATCQRTITVTMLHQICNGAPSNQGISMT